MWEYKTTKLNPFQMDSLEDHLNFWAARGWELHFTTNSFDTDYQSSNGYFMRPTGFIVIFKRLKA
jgi:hypothetical protein